MIGKSNQLRPIYLTHQSSPITGARLTKVCSNFEGWWCLSAQVLALCNQCVVCKRMPWGEGLTKNEALSAKRTRLLWCENLSYVPRGDKIWKHKCMEIICEVCLLFKKYKEMFKLSHQPVAKCRCTSEQSVSIWNPALYICKPFVVIIYAVWFSDNFSCVAVSEVLCFSRSMELCLVKWTSSASWGLILYTFLVRIYLRARFWPIHSWPKNILNWYAAFMSFIGSLATYISRFKCSLF